MPEDLFESLTQGMFIDLSVLSQQEIELLGSRPFRTCPECHGDCIVGMALAMSAEGLVVIPLPCPVCEGQGEVAYITDN
jgi:DnaJ-class molecular chaperone